MLDHVYNLAAGTEFFSMVNHFHEFKILLFVDRIDIFFQLKLLSKKKKVIYNPLGQEQNVTFAHKSQAAAKGSMRFILPNFRCLHSTGADTQPAPRGHPPSCSHSRGMSE